MLLLGVDVGFCTGGESYREWMFGRIFDGISFRSKMGRFRWYLDKMDGWSG